MPEHGGTRFYHMSRSTGDIPPGYRIVTANWYRQEDDPRTGIALEWGPGQIFLNEETGLADGVMFVYDLQSVPAVIRFEVVLERSEEPDVVINLGHELRGS